VRTDAVVGQRRVVPAGEISGQRLNSLVAPGIGFDFRVCY